MYKLNEQTKPCINVKLGLLKLWHKPLVLLLMYQTLYDYCKIVYNTKLSQSIECSYGVP